MKENTPLKRASQPDTRSQQGDLPFYLFGLLKERKKVWQLSFQVQAVTKGRPGLSCVHTALLFHINKELELSMRCRQMKAISYRQGVVFFYGQRDEFV